MTRFKEALDGWTQGRLTQAEAALLLGQCECSFRRHIERYQADGLDGLLDKRLSQISKRRGKHRIKRERAPLSDEALVDDVERLNIDGIEVPVFSASWTYVPLPSQHVHLASYFERLMAHASVALAIDQARPWFKFDPGRAGLSRRFFDTTNI